MSDRIYIDTNIWVYLYSENTEKSKQSEDFINEHFNQIILSTQVLNELFNVLAIKLRLKSREETKQIINDLIKSFEVFTITSTTVLNAIDLSINYQYRFFDCLMIASALENKCSIFYSEDLHDGQIIDNRLTIVNPYK